jgi:MoaA/NifB/PqqE/SkfB family radical SAM enzyme
MHAETAMSDAGSTELGSSRCVTKGLDFLWLELTNRCNLRCVHCYTESHPLSGDRDLLTTEDYESIISQAYELGCRKVQFIGGEPLVNRDFKHLLRKVVATGYEFIEVFSNLTRLDEETVRYAAENGVCFATSVYSDDPAEHDAVTKVESSHARTIGSLKKLVAAGITVRAAVIAIDQDEATLGRTQRYLRALGVPYVREGPVREFGRGERILSQSARLSGLCGHCWAGKLCIAPDGTAYPCVMSRQWPVGHVLKSTLQTIVDGMLLRDMRETIYDTVWLPKLASAHKMSAGSSPGSDPDEDDPGKKDPEPSPRCEPSCPQSPGPPSCPQSCSPVPPQSCAPHHPRRAPEPPEKKESGSSSG